MHRKPCPRSSRMGLTPESSKSAVVKVKKKGKPKLTPKEKEERTVRSMPRTRSENGHIWVNTIRKRQSMLTSASAGTRLSWTPVEFWIRFTHIGGEILLHEVLATCSGCGRHKILEQKWFGFRGGSGIRSTFQHGLKAQFRAKTHWATRAKLQPSSAHVLLVKMDARIPKHSDSK